MNNFRQAISTRRMIVVLLFTQLLPFIPLPFTAAMLDSQEWWLPVILAALTILGVVQILRGSLESWPWHLLSFSQGFNIISRLMMILPHATTNVNGVQGFAYAYVFLSLASMAFSAFFLWYTELPDVRIKMLNA